MSAAVNSAPARNGTSARRASIRPSARSQPAPGGDEHGVVGRQVEPAQDHVAAHVRLQVAVREVEPVEVLRKVGVGRRQREAATAVLRDDVVDDRSRFGQHQIAVGDHRRSAQRVQGHELGRREVGLRVAHVVLQHVGHAELFAEPDDPLRLGFAEMVDGQHVSSARWKTEETQFRRFPLAFTTSASRPPAGKRRSHCAAPRWPRSA